MARRLARAFNTTPELWSGLQTDVDLWKAAIERRADNEQALRCERK